MDKIALSPNARADLKEIVAFIAEDNPKAAALLLNRFSHLHEILTDNPMLGRPSMLKSLGGVHVFPIPEFSNYLVFYRILPKMEITRVLHSARDVENLL